MSGLVIAFAGPLPQWLALGELHRVTRLAVIILGAVAVYFGVLFALGLRYRHLMNRLS
jgi:peptidoglycan biosynthesis protein MviN/MurJ (putative lipid II flippase)